jgi:hypothetical protein
MQTGSAGELSWTPGVGTIMKPLNVQSQQVALLPSPVAVDNL